MDNKAKDKLIQEKFSTLKKPVDFEMLWQQEKEKRWQLLSINSTIGKEFKWELSKIEEWCLEQGFDGMEIRLQDFFGFGSQADFESLNNMKPRGIITVHLSDWAQWIDRYKDNQDRLMQMFYSQENISKYFGGQSAQALFDRLTLELETALNIGAKAATWHANQIDYEEIIFSRNNFTDQSVMEAVRDFIAELVSQKEEFGEIITLENGSAVDRGVRNFCDFNSIFSKPALEKVGITLDTAHLTGSLVQIKRKSNRVENILIDDLTQCSDLIPCIKVVHLSDTLMGQAVSTKLATEDLDKAKQDFWYKRALVREIVIDDHFPLGFNLVSARELLDLVSRSAAEKVCVVSELKAGSFEAFAKAVQIQKYNIVRLSYE